ncbi:hypothetical protein RKD49_006834 [Streptomyces glaucescens]
MPNRYLAIPEDRAMQARGLWLSRLGRLKVGTRPVNHPALG